MYLCFNGGRDQLFSSPSWGVDYIIDKIYMKNLHWLLKVSLYGHV